MNGYQMIINELKEDLKRTKDRMAMRPAFDVKLVMEGEIMTLENVIQRLELQIQIESMQTSKKD